VRDLVDGAGDLAEDLADGADLAAAGAVEGFGAGGLEEDDIAGWSVV